ncbi:MAG: hypothetical protein ABR541_03155 [Candidatus Dormibacteria bacterium]
MSSRFLAIAVAIAGIALTGCGSDDNGIAGAAPNDALSRTSDALNSVSSYHLHFVSGRRADAAVIDIDVSLPGKARGKATFGGRTTTDLVYLDHTLYFHGGTFLAQVLAPAALTKLGDRWLKSPKRDTGKQGFAFLTDASAIGHCLTGSHGPLVNGGRTTVDGQPASVVADRGNQQGDAPLRVSIASRGDAFPLLIEQLGPRAGAPPGDQSPCFPGDGSSLHFSAFGAPVDVSLPAKVADVNALR